MFHREYKILNLLVPFPLCSKHLVITVYVKLLITLVDMTKSKYIAIASYKIKNR